MIKCHKCQNTALFTEIHVGGCRKHQWMQDTNGRFVFAGSNYDEAEDTLFKCGKCHTDLSEQYRKFLQALFQIYDEKKDGI